MAGQIGQIKVVNKRNLLIPELGWTDVYVGRPSPLGNPYPMKSEDEREAVIKLYRLWLWKRIKWTLEGDSNQLYVSTYNELVRIIELVKTGNNVRLICWCSPKSCHADIIARAVNWLLTK